MVHYIVTPHSAALELAKRLGWDGCTLVEAGDTNGNVYVVLTAFNTLKVAA